MLDINKHRLFGQHFIPENIFNEYIFPEIKDKLYDYKFVDMFAGEGNLILPILKNIPEDKRVDYFKKHIFLFDIQPELVDIAIKRAESYGIPREIATQNIKRLDTLQYYPEFLLSDDKALQHNFYLRGFKQLIIVRKSDNKRKIEDLKVKWNYYER